MTSVDTRYVNIKDQPNYYFYVHYNIETYLDYVKNNAQLYQFGSLEKQTREQYRTLAKQAEKTMHQLNQTLPEGVEAMEIVKQLDQYVKKGNSPILNYENNMKNLEPPVPKGFKIFISYLHRSWNLFSLFEFLKLLYY